MPRFSRVAPLTSLAATVLSLMAIATLASPALVAQNRVATASGELLITPLAHASVQIEMSGRVVQVDPWSAADLDRARPADLVLVTDADAGGHHLDNAAIAKVRKHGAPIVMPASGRAKVADGVVLNNGDTREFANLQVEAIAAYDLTPGEPFHAKGVANGYVVSTGGTRIYIAGVTECVPEVRALRHITVMFVPMNLPNGRMTPAAAAECVRTIAPAVVYPYHYDQGYIRRRSDGVNLASPADILRTLDVFADALQAGNSLNHIEVRRGAWYPAR